MTIRERGRQKKKGGLSKKNLDLKKKNMYKPFLCKILGQLFLAQLIDIRGRRGSKQKGHVL